MAVTSTLWTSCFLLGVAAAASASGLRCKGMQGEDVDWFVFYKLPVSYTLLYMDPSHVTWTQLKTPITGLNQPVGFTLDQVYKKKSEVFGFYNDGLPPNGNAPYTLFYGHAKGAFAFDATSGFWLIHSIPRFPLWTNSSYQYPRTGYRYGQVGLCLSLSTDSLKQLETIFHYIDPWLYDSSISSAFSQLYPAFSLLLASSNSSVANASAPNAIVSLTTIGGLEVRSFAKHRSFNADLYSSWVAPTLMTGLSVESWLKEANAAKANSLPSNCAGKYPVNNVRSMALGKGIAFASMDDHSKWAISTDSNLAWVCIGDINRQSSQARRSGGTNCFQHAQVWNAFHRAIAQIEPCTASLSSLNPGTVLLLVAVLGLTLWWIKPGKVKGRHPPGPAKWPIVGNLFSLKMGALDETLTEWRTRFGDIFEMYLGSRHVIVICGYENLREFLTKTGEAFLDRPNLAMAKASKFGSSGIILTNGHKWRETRRFSLIAMKDLGLGHQSLPDVVLAEARALCDRLLHRCNKAINLRPFFTNGVANVICSIVFGRGFEYDDPAFLEVTGALTRLVARGGGNSLVTIFPWLRYLPFFKGASNDRNAVERFIQSQVEEHRSSFDPKQTRDFIDFYLLVETGQSDFDKDIFNEAQMYSIIRDLFVAGTETTATTLLWAVVFMVLHPDVQERCREEILKIFGPDGAPNVSCRDQLPYVEATLLEIQRLGDIVPFGVLRTCAKDTAFKGFTIPKGTEVMTFLHSAHSDPKVWPEPSRFLPERWLSEDGKLVRHEQLITFSLGRRNCLGENVAKTELFLFFTLLLQQLRFTAPAGSPPLTTKGIAGGTRSPLPFEVVLTSVEAN